MNRIENLPNVPKWQHIEITLDGYLTKEPMVLYWRDGLEVVKSLFSNPIFARSLDLSPYQHRDATSNERVYGEFMSADFAWEYAVRINFNIFNYKILTLCQNDMPPGDTMVPIILASDKTHLTVGTGNKEMHPLLISIANIHARVRMKATLHAFALIAYLPIPKFLNVSPPVQAALSARVYHFAVGLATKNLAAAGAADSAPTRMSDPNGIVRQTHTPLASHISDLPEQRLLALVLNNQSPTSTASQLQFGNDQSLVVHPRRTRTHTLANITRADVRLAPGDNLTDYLKISAKYGLNGVDHPYWEFWGEADPSYFLTPDALHSWHKFYFDHVRTWAINIMGGPELDHRMAALQPCVGARHWPHGVSTLKQLTGREHRDLEKILVAVIAGAVPTEVLRAIRAITEFIFHGQGLLIHEEQLTALSLCMNEFHHYKNAIIKHGGRKGKSGSLLHFNIPKLEAMGAVVESIKQMGAAYQHSSETSERYHIILVKEPYRESNKRHYHSQMVRNLIRKEKMRAFQMFTTLLKLGPSLINFMIDEASALADHFPETTWLSHVLPEGEVRLSGVSRSQPTNLFSKDKKYLSNDCLVAFTVTHRPHHKLSVADTAARFALRDFRGALGDFTTSYTDRGGQRKSTAHCALQFTEVHVWNSLRMQQSSTQDSRILLPPRTVQALPPSAEMPYGRGNVVMVDDPSGVMTSSDTEREFYSIIPTNTSNQSSTLQPAKSCRSR